MIAHMCCNANPMHQIIQCRSTRPVIVPLLLIRVSIAMIDISMRSIIGAFSLNAASSPGDSLAPAVSFAPYLIALKCRQN